MLTFFIYPGIVKNRRNKCWKCEPSSDLIVEEQMAIEENIDEKNIRRK